MYKIEKGCPIPGKNGKGGRKRIYPFAEMNVGDSFFVECSLKEKGKKQSSIIASAHSMKYLIGEDKKFVSRQIKDGIRVWRVK